MTQEPIQSNLERILQKTPYEAEKTAELDVQFSIDPSFGLTRQRMGWFSGSNFLDSSYFTEGVGSINMETPAETSTDGGTARLRSAYPGKYISHTQAEPGVGLQIPSKHLEYDTSGRGETVSLTHGEITAGLIEVDLDINSGINTIAISFEDSATYMQVRRNDQDIEKVAQENWNIDPLDGTGPSGKTLRPEDGLVYNFPHTWYGQGAIYLAVQDTKTSSVIPVHRAEIDTGTSSLGTPNMPVQVAVENKTTADPLQANVGGMQYVTHGGGNLSKAQRGRQTEVTARTTNKAIDVEAVFDGVTDALDPYAEPGIPAMAVRRDLTDVDSRTSLSIDTTDIFVSSEQNVYVMVWDEFEEDTALTEQNFRQPQLQRASNETRIQVDTEATDYTPSANAVLRAILFVTGNKQQTGDVAGDSNARIPIDAARIVTAAIQPGANTTDLQPIQLTTREMY